MDAFMIWALVFALIDRYESCVATPAVTTPATAACLNCAQNLIAVTMLNAAAKPMDNDATVTTTGCAVRTFTCLGTAANNPNIEINNGLGAIQDGDDGAVDGVTTFTVTCNAAGTAWENTGISITQVECAVGAVATPCLACAANLITVTTALPGAKAMDGDVTDVTGACAVRTFTCQGMSPVIELNAGATQVTDAADGAADGTATVVATCNAAGTAWEVNGMAITNVECTIPCQVCDAAMLTLTTMFGGVIPTTPATIDRTGACATWQIQCTGAMNPSFDINGGGGIISDADDGMIDGFINIDLTCKADGTAWTGFGADITALECFLQ